MPCLSLEKAGNNYQAWSGTTRPPIRSVGAFSVSEYCEESNVIGLKAGYYLIQDQDSPRYHLSKPEKDINQSLQETLNNVRFNELVIRLKQESPWPYTNELVDRIKSLREAAQEEEDQRPLNLNSLRKFLDFMKTNNWLRKPGITLSYEGEASPIWHRAKDMHFAILFSESGTYRYTLKTPSEDSERGYIGASGEVLDSRIVNLLETYDAISWLRHDG